MENTTKHSGKVHGATRQGTRAPVNRSTKGRKNGYVMPPGTGPEGKTCKQCVHKITTHSRSSKSFAKCWANKAQWTRSYGTDILVTAKACAMFTDIPALIAAARREMKAAVKAGRAGVFEAACKLEKIVDDARQSAVDAYRTRSKQP